MSIFQEGIFKQMWNLGCVHLRTSPVLQHKTCGLQCKNKLNYEPEAKNLKCSWSVCRCMHSFICSNHRKTDTIWAVEWMGVIWSSLPTHISGAGLSLVSASFVFWSLTVTEQQSLKTAPRCYGHTVFAFTEKTQNILTPNSETMAKYKAYLVEYDQHILYNMNERCP
jgi:hypothetical protein